MSLLDALNEEETPEHDGPLFSVIIPAAGASSRFEGFPKKKPFVEIDGRAVWLRTADHFVNRADVAEVVVVIASDDMVEFREKFRPNLAFMNVKIVEGGASRADSVRNGLDSLSRDSDYVAVHDAARPLLTKPWIDEIFAAAVKHQAVIPGVRVSSTVKSVDSELQITATVDRSNLILAQTPQVFARNVLETAYKAAADASEFTDEASLVEAAGTAVFVHEAWPMNIKITTREDFEMARGLLKVLPKEGGLDGLL